jgi:DNA-directed RNA polymerase subunit RPC12/RpoP
MLKAICESCGESFLVSDDTAGQRATCPACGTGFVVKRQADEEEVGPLGEEPWEYTVLLDMGRMGHVDEKKLNNMGRQGWELVSVFRESPESHTAFYFKRRMKPT